MNVLIIPFPFSVEANCFHPSVYNDKRSGLFRTHRFDVKQNWLTGDNSLHEKIVDSIEILIRSAEREGTEVNAVILPELALNYYLYAKLVRRLATSHQKVEWLISGVSERPRELSGNNTTPPSWEESYDAFDRRRVALDALEGERKYWPELYQRHKDMLPDYIMRPDGIHPPRPWQEKAYKRIVSGRFSDFELIKGNYVATTSFLRHSLAEVQTYITTFQAKHHRWVLDRQQIEEYNLSSVLDLSKDWWENIDTATRSVEFTTFRGGSTVVALCCEDLARLEPCQNLIRATGPNLVVALLMDGAQIVSRWPARYSTVLAEDPGSSVLTLTSSGLMARTSKQGRVGHRIIGLWKHTGDNSREIEIPAGCHAAVLRLTWDRDLSERTLDGRGDHGLGTGWKLVEAIPLQDSELIRDLAPEFTGRR